MDLDPSLPKAHLEQICQVYGLEDIDDVILLTSGHIHKSYKLVGNTRSYLLQRLNTNVFPDTLAIFENVSQVQFKLEGAMGKDYPYRWYLTKKQEPFIQLDDDHRYRLLHFIDNAITYSACDSDKMATEAGKILGSMHAYTYNIAAETLHEIIPNFHDMSFRIQQLEDAMKEDKVHRLKSIVDQLYYVNDEKDKWLDLNARIRNGEILLHATHSDPKLENILFDKDQNAICLIDLDTIMAGCYLFDVGDLLRSCCSPYTEDDPEPHTNAFNKDYFDSIIRSYASQTRDLLHESEWLPLAGSGLYMTFIMAIRFLADYLNGDVYYQIEHPEHNLHRCLNQLNLYKQMKARLPEMEQVVREAFEKNRD